MQEQIDNITEIMSEAEIDELLSCVETEEKPKKKHRSQIARLIYLIETKTEKLPFLKTTETENYIAFLKEQDELHKKQAKTKSDYNTNYRMKSKVKGMTKEEYVAYIERLNDIFEKTHAC